MVDPGMVQVLGRSAFHDTSLISSGDLSYLGGDVCTLSLIFVLNLIELSKFLIGSFIYMQWRRDVAFAGFDVPLQMDISAEKMIFGVQGIDPKRRENLIKVFFDSGQHITFT